MKRELSIIESILFVSGDKVETKKIAKIIEASEKDTEKLIEYLRAQYDDEKKGIRIIKIADGYQMTTCKENFDFLTEISKETSKTKFTQAILETLSIIAYKQPITKIEIEEIRGVSCEHAITKLIERNIIEEVGRVDKPGKPILFGTTDEFLRYFGFASINELNKYREEVIDVKYNDFENEDDMQ